MAGEVETDMPSGIDAPLAFHIAKATYDSRESKSKAGPTYRPEQCCGLKSRRGRPLAQAQPHSHDNWPKPKIANRKKLGANL